MKLEEIKLSNARLKNLQRRGKNYLLVCLLLFLVLPKSVEGQDSLFDLKSSIKAFNDKFFYAQQVTVLDYEAFPLPTSNAPANGNGNQVTAGVPATASDPRKKFFLSYSRTDFEFAAALKAMLEKQGYVVWMDVDCIEPGTEWRHAIDNAIKSAFALILVMSPAAKKSEYVNYEWAFALGGDIKVIPIMLKKTALHPRLEPINYLDFSKDQKKPLDLLFNTLHKITGGQQERTYHS